ncbi:MAG: family 43 glycosylhydrolase [Planctomycetes bacterium]|nr:family 43 glycosylhydrolase [Planctomycetota bacterium]
MRAAHLVALLWCLGLCTRSPAATQAARAPVTPPALGTADPASEAFYCTWPSEQATLLKPCIDIPLRDVSVCRGHDGWYYLTGTTGYPDWEIRNEGIWVWRSRDLKDWERIGKVWDVVQDGTWQKQEKSLGNGKTGRAVWAPEIRYFRETYWISYAMNWGGTGLLMSTTGKIAGPYEDMGQITPDGFDASLFVDDDGKAYWVYQDGRIARMTEDLKGLAEKPRAMLPAAFEARDRKDVNATRADRRVGSYGAFLTKLGGKYLLFCSERFERMDAENDDVFVAAADQIKGPYTRRALVLPHAGQSMLFKGLEETLWMTFSGDRGGYAPFVDKPGLVPMEWNVAGALLRPSRAVILERGPVAQLHPVADLPLRDSHVLADPCGLYTMVAAGTEEASAGEILFWRSEDMTKWRPLGPAWAVEENGTWSKTPPADWQGSRPLRVTAPEIHYLRKTYWIPYGMNWMSAGLLKSGTGRVTGPYRDVSLVPLTEKSRDGSLFADDDGQVYYIFNGGMLARMKEGLTGFAEDPRQLLDGEGRPIGTADAFMVKIRGRYVLGAARWHGDQGVDGSYDLMIGIADRLEGPYSLRRCAVPHGGGGSFFRGHDKRWYSTLSGHDRTAPFRSRPGILPLDVNDTGGELRIAPAAPQ